ncbi:MAG: ATP cone domain-containing protein [Nitrospinota bacterium]|nr:ATP cone domain-containing protein [Nitrospinota bacterium]
MGKSAKPLRSINIEKASGKEEPFSEAKLRNSLRSSGASEELADRVLALLTEKLGAGISTEKIYRLAFKLLHKEARYLAARYSLRRAIMNLGPSGFPFEKLIAAIFRKQDYRTELDRVLQGACISHEVDVIATRNNHRLFVECKYHNNHGKKCDVKVALYVRARALDLQNNKGLEPFNEFWLATNTKFTQDAIRYGQCAGLKLLGWDFPQGRGLKELIQLTQVHPITCLTTLKKADKNRLLQQRVVLCGELEQQPEWLESLNLTASALNRIREEISSLKTC